MDRRTRRDVGVASAIGTAIVAATLGVGHVFAPADPSVVRASGGGLDGAPIAVVDGARARAGLGDADGRPGPRGAGSSARGSDASPSGASTVRRVPSRSAAGARGSARPATAGGDRGRADAGPAGVGRAPGPADGGASRPGDAGSAAPDPAPQTEAPGDDATVGDDGTLITAAVRLRVTDLSVTGTDSGTLRSGSEVRVRLAARRETVTSGASAAGRGDATPAAEADATLPERLDVRIRLDDDAVATLGATAADAAGPLALRALVDLVDTPDAAPYAVRVRMQLTPAAAARAAVSDGERTDDGASNVVAVETPIGEVPGGAVGEPPADWTGTPPATGSPGTGATPDPVEVRVPLPTGDATTTPDDGASVPVPIPVDPAPPSGEAPAPTAADAAVVVHVPAADEPIGGTPEVLPPDATALPGADAGAGSGAGAESGVAPDAGAGSDAVPGADAGAGAGAGAGAETGVAPDAGAAPGADAVRGSDGLPDAVAAPSGGSSADVTPGPAPPTGSDPPTTGGA